MRVSAETQRQWMGLTGLGVSEMVCANATAAKNVRAEELRGGELRYRRYSSMSRCRVDVGSGEGRASVHCRKLTNALVYE